MSHRTCNRLINNTSARCASVTSLSRSGRGGESQTFCRVFTTPHLFDVGTTVTCLVHGEAAESQSVGGCFEQFCCGKVIEKTDDLHQISILQPGQKLVDALKPALVQRWSIGTNPSRTLVQVKTLVSYTAITADQHGRSGTSDGTISSIFHFSNSDKRMHVASKVKMSTAT